MMKICDILVACMVLCAHITMARRISIFIATFSEDDSLKHLLTTLSTTDYGNATVKINIINNSEIPLKERTRWSPSYENVSIYDDLFLSKNDFGHLAHTWNQAILKSFGDLQNPLTDILITLQADCSLVKSWFTEVDRLLENGFSFMQFGWGDEFLVHTVDSIKRIGLFDERFNSLVRHEKDYFIRGVLYNRNGSALHDYHHSRLHNNVGLPHKVVEYSKRGSTRPTGESHLLRVKAQSMASYNGRLLEAKYGCFLEMDGMNFAKPIFKDNQNRPPCIQSFMLYPWFEKYLNNLTLHNFFL